MAIKVRVVLLAVSFAGEWLTPCTSFWAPTFYEGRPHHVSGGQGAEEAEQRRTSRHGRGLRRAASFFRPGELRATLYAALCASAPCPLGLLLEDIRQIDDVGARVRFAVSPPAGTSSLQAIHVEAERQLKASGSALRRAGVVGMSLKPKQLELLFEGSTETVATVSPTVSVLAARRLDVIEPVVDIVGDSIKKLHGTLSNVTGNTDEPDAAKLAGVKTNSAGDFSAFLSSFVLNVAMVLACFVVFSIARFQYPVVFQGAAEPGTLPNTCFGWIGASLSLKLDFIIEKAGLDHGMLIEFTHLSMQVFAAIGIPFLLVLSPLHFFLGGAEHTDRLSELGMGNVADGSWLYWVHALAVWYVALVTQFLIFRAQRRFLPRRYKWLKEMPPPRSTTVLVEGIPIGKNTTEGLRRYFDVEVFGRPVVRSSYIVKDTSEIVLRLQELQHARHALARVESSARAKKSLDMIRASMVTSISDMEQNVFRLQHMIHSNDKYNKCRGFVTFEHPRDSVIAKKLFSEADEEEIVVTTAPDPADVLWKDLCVDPRAEAARELLGYCSIGALFIFTIPLVFLIASTANFKTLQRHITLAEDFARDYPELATLWDGVVGAVALTAIMSFVPSILVIIFSNLFVLKSKALLQHKVQTWFFQFQVVFVLLITSIGTSLVLTGAYLLQHPLRVFSLLADTMPLSTNFYVNMINFQWLSHAMTLTRYMNLTQFLLWRRLYGDARAKELSEPEDQDYNGMGSRSSRFTLVFVVVLVFCTLNPLMVILGMINFALCRLIYAYLFVYAETRKPDLGGVFWCAQLTHIQFGLFLYVTLMAGVLFERAKTSIPGYIASSCFFFLTYTYRRFHRDFRWQFLEYNELPDAETFYDISLRTKPNAVSTYKQPELPSQEVNRDTIDARLTMEHKDQAMESMKRSGVEGWKFRGSWPEGGQS